MANNLWVTCSGHFNQAAFVCTMMTMGVATMLFAIDWPFENNQDGVDCLMRLPVCEADRHAIAHGNTERLLRL